jgi:hypothetical protein
MRFESYSTVSDDFSVFVHLYILTMKNIYPLSAVYMSSLYKLYSKIKRNAYNVFIKHIYRVCTICIMFVQLTPHTPSRITPRVTVTKAVPARFSLACSMWQDDSKFVTV